jgi:hypothetical protein
LNTGTPDGGGFGFLLKLLFTPESFCDGLAGDIPLSLPSALSNTPSCRCRSLDSLGTGILSPIAAPILASNHCLSPVDALMINGVSVGSPVEGPGAIQGMHDGAASSAASEGTGGSIAGESPGDQFTGLGDEELGNAQGGISAAKNQANVLPTVFEPQSDKDWLDHTANFDAGLGDGLILGITWVIRWGGAKLNGIGLKSNSGVRRRSS